MVLFQFVQFGFVVGNLVFVYFFLQYFVVDVQCGGGVLVVLIVGIQCGQDMVVFFFVVIFVIFIVIVFVIVVIVVFVFEGIVLQVGKQWQDVGFVLVVELVQCDVDVFCQVVQFVYVVGKVGVSDRCLYLFWYWWYGVKGFVVQQMLQE